MKTASISDIKKELATLKPAMVFDYCMRLAKFKRENKELLAYLLFESHDEQGFIEHVKEEIDQFFDEMNISNLYLAKKSVRKILRNINKKIKYSGLPQTEVELLMYFCHKLNRSQIKVGESTALINLYDSQIKKIRKALFKLHEDIQFDYEREMEELIDKM